MTTYIKRVLIDQLADSVQPGKVVVLYGPRQVGKTTLLQHYLKGVSCRYRFYDGEDLPTQRLLTSQSVEKFRSAFGDLDLVVIDEAQKVEKIGLNLKLIVDHLPQLRLIASGSSSFDLARQIGEPLTGRKFTLTLYPLSQLELNSIEDLVTTQSRLEERLIYGSYPEVVTTPGLSNKERLLGEIVSSYLYKDLLELEGIRYRRKVVDLLQLLAFQIGREVSLSELGRQLGMSVPTVDRYLDLLEKAFVLINVRGFSRNLRKEVTKNSRYYFYDVGIRNALVNNFNPLKLRRDVGELWENYLVVERLKKQSYRGIRANNFFWRTHDRQEIDWVEERGGKLYGYEFKWQSAKARPPRDWQSTYPQARFELITSNNYLDFIT